MFKNFLNLFIIALLAYGIGQLSYPSKTPANLIYKDFFLEQVLTHIDNISKEPHYVGAKYHRKTQRYIIKQLQKLELNVSLQKTVSFDSKRRVGAPIENIITKIPGSKPGNKALLLLSHYDSAKYFASGAADNASGVAIILEGIRALIRSGKKPENDIIILFTDGEELGLLGAKAYVEKQHVANNVGLVINFEARGSSGPAIMLLETTTGTSELIKAFKQLNVPFPVSNSIYYEIYKAMPNDTDLTMFKKVKNINGYNFAFIDDHFNYHTQVDDLEHLSLNSLAHQLTYFKPMLEYFSDANLADLYSDENLVYFNVLGLGIIDYPYSWVLPINILTVFLFFVLLGAGLKSQKLSKSEFAYSFRPFLKAIVLITLSVFIIIKLLYWVRPDLNDILQGFPYQGYIQMYGLMIFTLISTAYIYSRIPEDRSNANLMFAPLLTWLVILSLLGFYLPGSSFLMILLLAALLLFGLMIFYPRIAKTFALLLMIPAIIVIAQLLLTIPVALGFKTTTFAALGIVLLISVFNPIVELQKNRSLLILMFLPLGFLLYADYKHEYNASTPHPNSLSYLIDTDKNLAWWYSFDATLNDWNKHYFQDKLDSKSTLQWRKENHQPVKLLSAAPKIKVTDASIEILKNSTSHPGQSVLVDIKVNRLTQLAQIYTDTDLVVKNMSVNGVSAAIPEENLILKKGSRLFEYNFNSFKDLKFHLIIEPVEELQLVLYSHQFNLLENTELNVKARTDKFMPKPFIKTDNIVIKQSLTLSNDQ